MLDLRNVTAGYGAFTALWDVALRVDAGEAVAVVGPNGAGKTTLLRVISGVIPPRTGDLVFEGASLGGHPAHDIVAHGIAHVPEGRRLFPLLTVAENLKMGAFLPSARARFPSSRSGRSSARAASPAGSSRCSRSAARSCRSRS
jgi:branched-chain amino acid transport system ATP-binding protein